MIIDIDAPIREEERNMTDFDCKGLASLFIMMQWDAVFSPAATKTSKQERIDAYDFFTNVDGYWAEQREIWCESYLDLCEEKLRTRFVKVYKEKRDTLNMPVVNLTQKSKGRLERMIPAYRKTCAEIEIYLKSYSKGENLHKFALPPLLQAKAEYDRIFAWVLRADLIDPLYIKIGQRNKKAAYWKKEVGLKTTWEQNRGKTIWEKQRRTNHAHQQICNGDSKV